MRKDVFLFLVIAGLLLSYHLNKPFVGHHDWNGVFWGNTARGYLRGHFTYFPHYTPLLPILFSISGLFFGIHEWSLRLVTVCFSLAMLVAIFKIGEFLYGRMVGIVAMVLAMVTPMFLYFGKLPDHEPIVTSLITIAFYFYLRLGEKTKNVRLYFFCALLFAFLESWASYFLIPFLFFHAVLFEKKRLPAVLKGAMIGILIVILHVASIYLFSGQEGFTNFLHAGAFRLNVDTSAKHASQFTWPQFFVTEARYSVIYFTRTLLVLSAMWFICVIARSLRRRGNLASDLPLLILFFTAASFLLVFSNLSFIHDYKLYLLLPFLALAGAQSLVFLSETVRQTIKNRLAGTTLAGALLALAIAGVATERIAYLQTLLDTSFNRPGYTLGMLINTKTTQKERVLVNSAEFASFYDVFVNFYADREVVFGDQTLEVFQRSEGLPHPYRYMVLVDNRPTDINLKHYLLHAYESEKIGDFTFVDLSRKI